MANRAYLLSVNDRSVTWSDDPEREILAEGINEIPVFWASLFTSADRQLDTYDGDEGELRIPNWCVEAAAARQRLGLLRKPVAELLDERSAELWGQWVTFISAQRRRFLKTNAAEVWALDPKGYDGYCATLLRAFSEPSKATMRAAIDANGLVYVNGNVGWDDDEETTCKLAGADHVRELPWLD